MLRMARKKLESPAPMAAAGALDIGVAANEEEEVFEEEEEEEEEKRGGGALLLPPLNRAEDELMEDIPMGETLATDAHDKDPDKFLEEIFTDLVENVEFAFLGIDPINFAYIFFKIFKNYFFKTKD
eukprot:TRINITY_DN4322_c0_g1_i1.p1 TRINITY_DN4322_c0_g1~~TRINITY_DN4322_c0_g1_i1.p1  ORF type:complete len:126 (-),score=54.35 TRINITY_DN4322_c0_g1_i1:38-415(-)